MLPLESRRKLIRKHTQRREATRDSLRRCLIKSPQK